jgi:hypothetical protein
MYKIEQMEFALWPRGIKIAVKWIQLHVMEKLVHIRQRKSDLYMLHCYQ